jgi:hypothetical protein
MRRVAIFTMAILLTAAGCGDPKDQKIPTSSDQWKQDEDFRGAIEKLSQEERELLTEYLFRAGMAESFGGSIPDISIGDAIENQREHRRRKAEEAAAEEAEEKRQEELARAAQEERERKIEEARKALTVAVATLDFEEHNFRRGTYEDKFNITIVLKNNTDKDMSGVKGTVVFADMFGDVIKQMGVAVDSEIPAGKHITWSGSFGYNQFMDADKKLRATAFEKLKITWLPEVYVYSDGTKTSIGG